MRRMYARFCRNDDIDIQLDFIDKIKDTDDMISSRRVRFPRRLFFCRHHPRRGFENRADNRRFGLSVFFNL